MSLKTLASPQLPALTDFTREEFEKINTRLKDLESKSNPYTVNCYNDKVHLVIRKHSLSNLQWATKCGWKFGTSNFKPTSRLPESKELICLTCFPEFKAVAGNEASETDGENSSDSS